MLTQSKKLSNTFDVSIDSLYDYFRNLNQSNESNFVPDDFSLIDCVVGDNDVINEPITDIEIEYCINNLKNNKSHGMDEILNEYIKCTKLTMIPIYVILFNVILDTGLVPTEWCSGMIFPIYKNKGSKDDVCNYRSITILSCFCKLFTSVINNRLTKFVESNYKLGPEQAGFRKNYSTLDHIFSLKCLIDLYIGNKKRLYAGFVDYRSAFDKIPRLPLWQKVLDCGITGKIFRVIHNLYKYAKSCVCLNRNRSDMFNCSVGVRQGENLSPLLFSIYLQDLSSFLSQHYKGLSVHETDLENVGVYLKLFALLYADDTVLLAESESELQAVFNAMLEYCTVWKLEINPTKTKTIVFSKGKIRKTPKITYGDVEIENVHEYAYLGIIFNFNGSFVKAKKQLHSKASSAMFSLIQKARKLNLDVDTQIHLFNCLVVTIALYGCEIWSFTDIILLERLQLRFCKYVLKVKMSTPNVMVYGELGVYPLQIYIKYRMINYRYKLVTGPRSKIAWVLYNTLYKSFEPNAWLNYIKDALNSAGLSYIWDSQACNINANCLKQFLLLRLKDQYQQEWNSTVHNTSKCKNYRLFKSTFIFEQYLIDLPPKYRHYFSKFRCRSHRLPIEAGVFIKTPEEHRICSLCNEGELGDEFHYIFKCQILKNERCKFIKSYYLKYPSATNMYKIFNSHGAELENLCKFISIIVNKFK
ncbi:hypothetical protein SNE40_014348 [Patella caerulea]|uniref:Reverse transcriptase domain-containing protein n=1 Tax=Patella caerulea TaxID=87958 RepID=A0AAN8PQB5_PATCE